MPLQRNSVPCCICWHWLSQEDPTSRNSLVILEPQDVSGKVHPAKSLESSGDLDTHGHNLISPAAAMGLCSCKFIPSVTTNHSFERNIFIDEAAEAHEQ